MLSCHDMLPHLWKEALPVWTPWLPIFKEQHSVFRGTFPGNVSRRKNKLQAFKYKWRPPPVRGSPPSIFSAAQISYYALARNYSTCFKCIRWRIDVWSHAVAIFISALLRGRTLDGLVLISALIPTSDVLLQSNGLEAATSLMCG